MTSPFEPIPVEKVPRVALSPAEAALSLGICERTITDLLTSGEIPSVRVGRRRLIPVRELRKWLTKRAAAGEGGAENG
jgi:excisionase family DNA binding protein